jgi:signal transduction histidine kinase
MDGAFAIHERMLPSVLHDFLTENRAELLARSRARLTASNAPTSTHSDRDEGLPLFLDELVEILRSNEGAKDKSHGATTNLVSASAARHGANLLQLGLPVGQVVQDYGSLCQSVAELADDRNVAITAREFQTLNGCLDDATARAVTEFEQQRDRTASSPGVAHLGFLAHEMRNLLNTSMLTFDALTRGTVGINGSTGVMHGRSLRRMRDLIDRTLAEVRLGANIQNSERVLIARLIEEISIGATMDAREYDRKLTIDAGPPELAVDADPQILTSVISNLVQNAFKYTRLGGQISILAAAKDDRVLIEVQDECGGLPPGNAEDLFRPFERRSANKTGLGLGLSICLRGVKASGGEIRVRDRPGTGCVFTVDLPMASPLS